MGGILVFLWTALLCMSGAIARAIKPDLAVPDEIGPWLAMNVMPGALGGIVLAGIVAGIQTTVAAKAIIITSSLARNLLLELRPGTSAKIMKTASRITMASCLAIAIALALTQPRMIQWIILFSIGGLTTATFAPVLIGFHWKRGNKWGTLVSIGCGIVVYGLANTVLPQICLWKTHPSFISVITSTLVYIGVSRLTPKPSEKVIRTFWGKPQIAPKRSFRLNEEASS